MKGGGGEVVGNMRKVRVEHGGERNRLMGSSRWEK